jgi:cysteinyl-tRNA synthetase
VGQRASREFAAADALREEVEARGFAVKDTGHGVVIERYL